MRARENLITSVTVVPDGSTIFGGRVVWDNDTPAKCTACGFIGKLADFEPKGEVARKYGVYRKGEGVSDRALFVIDGEGVISWSYISPIAVNPGADGILNALESLSAKKVAHGN